MGYWYLLSTGGLCRSEYWILNICLKSWISDTDTLLGTVMTCLNNTTYEKKPHTNGILNINFKEA